MFNLFVASDIQKYSKSYFTYPRERVFEYTSQSLVKKYSPITTVIKKELTGLPCLFAYESPRQLDARVGWVNDIVVSGNSVELEFEFDLSFSPIQSQTLDKIAPKLEILDYEMNRTHWALKNVNLFNVLFEEGIIQERKQKEFFVFICYASEDQSKAEELCDSLSDYGIKAWLDKREILPGQDWESEIHTAIRKSHAVIACLSKKSVSKEGFVQKELKTAIDIANEKPDDVIFIIPARLEDCEIPRLLSKRQWVDLFAENGFYKIMKSLEQRANSLSIRIRKV